MIEIKLAVMLVCAVCKLIGELCWHNAQRFVMPVIFSLAVSYIGYHSGAWWLGLTTLPMIAPITLGYKDYGPSDGFDRGAWLFVIALVAGLGPEITGHLSWFIGIPTAVLCGIWGGVSRKWWNVIVAPISGLLIGQLILWIH